MDKMIMVSGDSHCGLPAAEYAEYIDPRYRDEIASYVEDMIPYHAAFRAMGYPFPPEELEIIDKRGAIESCGVAGYFDPKRRLRETEAEGVVAELLHPAGPIAAAPFGDSVTRRVSPELRAAGVAAHNRFLRDFCEIAPLRLLGVPMTYPWPDIEAAVGTIHWARENGMAAVYATRFAGAENDELPPFYDRFWDPYWRACSETGLPVHIHAGHGRQQGTFTKRVEDAVAKAQGGLIDTSVLASFFDDIFPERRPLWQLMWSGVFDRFPGLRVAFVELRADWVPPTLEFLDTRQAERATTMELKPSEYWERHCAVTASFMRPTDIAVRQEVGIDKLMFATDYPHQEGTWPNTLDFLRAVLDDVPEEDARAIVGENAVRFYGLNHDALAEVAARVGPRPDELIGRADTVDERLIDHFDKRSGFRKPGSYFKEQDEDRLARYFEEDVRGAAQALAVRTARAM